MLHLAPNGGSHPSKNYNLPPHPKKSHPNYSCCTNHRQSHTETRATPTIVATPSTGRATTNRNPGLPILANNTHVTTTPTTPPQIDATPPKETDERITYADVTRKALSLQGTPPALHSKPYQGLWISQGRETLPPSQKQPPPPQSHHRDAARERRNRTRNLVGHDKMKVAGTPT